MVKSYRWEEPTLEGSQMTIPVTRSQMMAAKLRVKVDKTRRVTTPPVVRALAQARTATPADVEQLRSRASD